MQFPVPQFTDVEDKIIGPLTVKQFGILFAAGMVIVLMYSSTKSLLVGIFFFMLVGVPALAMAFGKINGRPVYATFGFLIKFATGPKVLIFHKEASNISHVAQLKDAELKSNQTPVVVQSQASQNPKERLIEVQKLLQQKAKEEQELLKKIS